MKQSADGVIFSQLVVQLSSGSSLLDVNRNAAVAKQLQRLRAGLQNQLHSPAQNDNLAAMVEQLSDIGRLNAWNVLGARLVPIPGAAAAGIEFEVLCGTNAINIHTAPGYVGDSWRVAFCFNHMAPYTVQFSASRCRWQEGRSRQVGFGVSQECDYLFALAMMVDPFAYPFNFLVVAAKALAIDCVEPGARFIFADVALPRCCKHEVHFVVKVAALEQIPLASVEPDAVAGGALIKSDPGAVPDLVPQHQAATVRADLDLGAVGGGDRWSLAWDLGQSWPVSIEPPPIFAA